MSFSHLRQKQPQILPMNWNCLTFKVKDQLFLANNKNKSINNNSQSSNVHHRNNSGNLAGSPPKKSLKNRKDKTMKGSITLVDNQQSSFKDVNSPLVSPTVSQKWTASRDQLFYQPQSATYRNRINYEPEPKNVSNNFISWDYHPLTPGNPPSSISFSTLSPSPVKIASRPVIEAYKTEQKIDYDCKIDNRSLRTTKVASNSESRNKIEIQNHDELIKQDSKKAFPIRLRQLEKQIERIKKIHNKKPVHTTQKKDDIFQSLMVADSPQKYQDKNRNIQKETAYSCRNFKSERSFKLAKKVPRMQEVEEVKSLVNSEENNDNDSDKESIVLERLQQLTQKGQSKFDIDESKKKWKVYGSIQLDNKKQ